MAACALALLLSVFATGASAQRASDNAAASAEDGFGGLVGAETTGIYGETDVRGFNPQQAGNIRIDDVYADLLVALIPRIKAGSAIRVGFTALNYPSPAPSGIVANRLRSPGNVARGTLGLNATPFGGLAAQYDGDLPVIQDKVSVAYGIYLGETRTLDGAALPALGLGVMPVFKLGEARINAYASGGFFNAKTRPLIVSGGPFLPPLINDRIYLGQKWADNFTINSNFGAVLHTPIAGNLRFRGGVFRSGTERRKNYTELYAVQNAAGASTHLLLSDPVQLSFANSWEGVFIYPFGDGDLRQSLSLGARGRYRHVESGGSQLFNYGPVQLGVQDPERKPAFTFQAVNLATLNQTNASLNYIASLKGRGQVNLGVTRSHYSADVRTSRGVTGSSADPWLYNASLLVTPHPRVSAYAGYVSGLEDSGAAPENADNRNEQLPASRTSQLDAGVRIAIARVNVVASVFQIRKPYFSFDPTGSTGIGRYRALGDLRQRGVEISATGDIGSRLHLVAGALFADPVVTGDGVTRGVIGPKPVGMPRVRVRIDASYRTDWDGLTFTATAFQEGRRAASAAPYAALGGKQLDLPSHPTLDLGLRQSFTVAGHPSSVRLAVQNIFDNRNWKVVTSNTFQLEEPRRFSLYILSDF